MANLKHSFHRKKKTHCEQLKHEHNIHNMNEKKNQSCTSLCSPECISQHGWSLFFRLQCQQNTSSTAPPRPAYPLESLRELHLFTKAFAWKLYKHSYTIKSRSYVTNVRQRFWPKCNNFHGLERPTHPVANAKTNCHIYNTHLHTISLQLLPPHICMIIKCKGH